MSDTDSLPDVKLPRVQCAPEVDTSGLSLVEQSVVSSVSTRQFPSKQTHADCPEVTRRLVDAAARSLLANPKIKDMEAPIFGPAKPDEEEGIPAALRNHWNGAVEDEHLDPDVFDEQYLNFHKKGYALDPTGRHVIGDKRSWDSSHVDKAYISEATEKRPRRSTAEKKSKSAALQSKIAAFDPSQPFQITHSQPWAHKEVTTNVLTEEQKAYMDKINAEKAAKKKLISGELEIKSIFHATEERQGGKWLEAPKDKKADNDFCYLPKRCIHTWSGHTKGVNSIQFFPKSGHLLLSASMDGKVKIWDVYNSGHCMQTYIGHSKGVRQIYFSNDGRRFLSAGYDCNVHLWDTETGEVIRTINKDKLFFVAKFHPDDNKQNVLMAGCADNRVYQFDLDTGEDVQIYDYHLEAVNTITFVDEGRRFVTSSDDKSLRIWEFGIPVQIKYIADPSMHSMPAITLHPSGNYFCGQSQDNQIVTYSTRERFRLNRKKSFRGHVNSGYACQIDFSPDSRYVMSGDGRGRCFFWEWQTPKKVVRSFQAHEKVCLGATWHPLESSKVATCGWDGLIKFWD